MKKFIFLLIIFVLLLGACSPRPLVSSVNLEEIGPRTQGELSSSKDVVVVPGVLPKSENHTAVNKDLVQVSAVTTEMTQNKVDDETEVRVFTSQLQTTQIQVAENPAVQSKINDTLENVARLSAAEAETVLNSAVSIYAGVGAADTDDFYAHSYSTSQTVTRLDTVVFSVVTYSSSYSGGDHSASTQCAANFDLSTGTRLALSDVLLPQQQEAVYKRMLQWLESRTKDYSLFPMEQCLPIVKDKFSPENMDEQYTDWHLTDNGLTVFFNPYEISPHSSGIIKIEFSYSELETALEPHYQPVLIQDQPLGSFVVYFNTEPDQMASKQETVRLGSGTDRLIIWGVEPIYDVSLTSVSRIGSQSVDIGTLYCANYLTAENMVIIELDDVQDVNTLCLRLNPGDGEERTIYFESTLSPGLYSYGFSAG